MEVFIRLARESMAGKGWLWVGVRCRYMSGDVGEWLLLFALGYSIRVAHHLVYDAASTGAIPAGCHL